MRRRSLSVSSLHPRAVLETANIDLNTAIVQYKRHDLKHHFECARSSHSGSCSDRLMTSVAAGSYEVARSGDRVEAISVEVGCASTKVHSICGCTLIVSVRDSTSLFVAARVICPHA